MYIDNATGHVLVESSSGKVYPDGCTPSCCGTCYCGTDESHQFPNKIKVTPSGVVPPIGVCQVYFELAGTSIRQYSIRQLDVPINQTFCLTKVSGQCCYTATVAATADYWEDAAGCQLYSPPDQILDKLVMQLCFYHRPGVGTIANLGAYLTNDHFGASTPGTIGFNVFYFNSLIVPGANGVTWAGATLFNCTQSTTVDNYATWYRLYEKVYDSFSGITFLTDPGGFCGGSPYEIANCTPPTCPCPGNPYDGIADIDIPGGC